MRLTVGVSATSLFWSDTLLSDGSAIAFRVNKSVQVKLFASIRAEEALEKRMHALGYNSTASAAHQSGQKAQHKKRHNRKRK